VRFPTQALSLPGGIELPPEEIRFEFARSGGPGGQNVNRVATKAVLRFDLLGSPSLPPEAKERLRAALAPRITAAGEVLVAASEHRTQERNRAAAFARFASLMRSALRPVRPRRPTRPTRASAERRLRAKRERSVRKRDRRAPRAEE
jgi:ribosome-associated protein